jgi:AcrR family transcriptional regulator
VSTGERDGDVGDGLELVWMRPERAERGRRPPLTRGEIVRAAIGLADAEGLEALSMRRLGARLGAGATSLYWHVASKEDLFELVFDEVLGELELPDDPPPGWREGLVALARQVRVVMQRHPWVVLLGVQPGLGPNGLRYFRYGAGLLREVGAGETAVIQVLAAVNNYVMGFGHRQTAWAQTIRRSGLGPAEWEARFRTYLEQVVSATDEELARQLAARLSLSGDADFEFGLACLVDGMAARLEAGRA